MNLPTLKHIFSILFQGKYLLLTQFLKALGLNKGHLATQKEKTKIKWQLSDLLSTGGLPSYSDGGLYTEWIQNSKHMCAPYRQHIRI